MPGSIASDLNDAYQTMTRRRWLNENILSMLLQFGGLKISTLSGETSLIWIASGISCGLIFLRGQSILPGIFLGGLFAYLSAHLPWWPSIGVSLLLSLQPILILWFSYRYLAPTLLFPHTRQGIIFIIFSGLLTAINTWLLLALCYPYLSLSTGFDTLWRTWWFANWAGVVLYAPALAIWDAYYTDFHAMENKRPLYLYFVLLFFASLFFNLRPGPTSSALLLLFLSCIGWRWGRLGILIAVMLSITTHLIA